MHLQTRTMTFVVLAIAIVAAVTLLLVNALNRPPPNQAAVPAATLALPVVSVTATGGPMPEASATATTAATPAVTVALLAPTPSVSPTLTAPAATATPAPSRSPTGSPPRPSATATTAGAALTAAPTLGVTLPITLWHTSTLLVGPGSPARLYALQRAEVTRPSTSYTEAVRLLVSDDGGGTWKPFAGGLPTNDVACLSTVDLDYATKDALYASTCQGLYRWTGSQWLRISGQKTGAVAVTYGKPNVIWATGFSPGPYILRSDDGGQTWQRADFDLDTFTGQFNIALDPRDGKTLYSMINPKYAGSYLRRGDTSGHWVTMPVPQQGYTYVGMTIDGATGALYVATQIFEPSGANSHWQLWRSVNPSAPGITQVRWEMVHDFGDAPADQWALVLASGASPRGLALYVRFESDSCSPQQGILCTSVVQRSLDGGNTWSALKIGPGSD